MLAAYARRPLQSPWLWLFCLALSLRLLYLASIPQDAIVESVDAQGYDLLARNLEAGHGFSLHAAPPYQPDGLRTPFYPLFISAIYTLSGPHPVAVALVQAVLDSLSALLLGALGCRLLGRRWGLAAAALYGLTPLQWRYAAALLTEIPLAFLILLAAWLWARCCETARGVGTPLVCGAVAGLAALCKPNAAGLVLILGLGVLLALRAEGRRALVSAGLILLAAAAVMGPWVVRNWAVFGEPFLSNAHLGFVARVSAPAALGEARDHRVAPWSPEWERRYVEVVSQAAARHDWHRPAESLTPRQAHQREKQVAQAAWEIVRAYPLEALWAHGVGFARSWAPQEQTFWYSHLSGRPWAETGVAPNALRDGVEILWDGRPAEAVQVAWVDPWGRLDPLGRSLWYGWSLAHLLGGVLLPLGLWRLRRRSAWAWLLAATVLYLTLPAGPIGYERFRVPATPLLTLLQVTGVASLSFPRVLA